MNFDPTPSGTGDGLGVTPFLGTTTAAAGVPAPAPAISQPQLALTSAPFGSLQQNQFTPGQQNHFMQTTNQFTAQNQFSVPPQQGFLAPQPQASTTTPAFVNNPSVSFQAAQPQPQPATAFMNQIPGSNAGTNFGMPSQPSNQSALISFESAAPQAGARPQSQSVPQSSAKFETKSSVWTDTLNRGLVNLNISGRKCSFLAFQSSIHHLLCS